MEEEMILTAEDVYTEKDRATHALHRRHSVTKAMRKRRITRNTHGGEDWYDNLHQYSKNKIHCSCPLCRFYGPAMQDIRRNEEMNFEESSYEDEIEDLAVDMELLADEIRQQPMNSDS